MPGSSDMMMEAWDKTSRYLSTTIFCTLATNEKTEMIATTKKASVWLLLT